MPSSRIFAFVLLVAACDAPVVSVDGGPPDASLPRGVQPAARPAIAPCAEGSVETTTPEGLVRCESPAVTECGDGEAWHEGRCITIGSACPGGDGFPSDLPATGVIYVRRGTSGDGTRASPYGTIARGMMDARSGSIIAVATGEYDEQVVMRSGVTVRGACAEGTVIAWTGVRGGGSVEAGAGVTGAAIADLTIGPSDNIGVLVRGAELRVSDVLVSGAMLMGVAVLEGSAVDASTLVVRDTRSTSDLGLGRGVVVEGGSRVTARDLVLERNTEVGLSAIHPETSVEVDGLTSIAPRIDGANTIAGGLLAGASARVVVRGALLERSIGAAVLALPGGTIELEDAEIRDVEAPAAGQAGWGMSALDATLIARRVSVREARGIGVGAYGTSLVQLSDALVVSTRSMDSEELAAGMVVAETATAEVEQMWIEDSSRVSLLVSGPVEAGLGEAQLTATDLTIVAMRDRADGAAGLFFQNAARGTVMRARIVRANELAVGVYEGASATLTDLVVQDTAPDLDSLVYGRGLEVLGGSATLSRALFERQSEIAIIVAMGQLEATELTIADTRERACAASTCADEPAGIGIGAYSGAAVSVEGFTIDGARLCGVQVHGGGGLDLRDGTIANATVGACVQIDDYDVGRLTDGVEFTENGVAVQSTSFAPPEPRDVVLDL